MALHLIIDGYNLIRQSPELLAQEAHDLRWGREALLEKLAAYRRVKKHPITVVFDGWETGEFMGNRDRFQGMLVIYSRRGEKADEVIKRLAEQERERSLIISSDREIIHHAERVGAAVMSAEEFSFRLQYACNGENSPEPEEEDVSWPGTKKKGPAHRAPKKLRRQNRRVKKI
jgi:predicted RNA-binding protein with PIN domain